jgi:hypothetical protein
MRRQVVVRIVDAGTVAFRVKRVTAIYAVTFVYASIVLDAYHIVSFRSNPPFATPVTEEVVIPHSRQLSYVSLKNTGSQRRRLTAIYTCSWMHMKMKLLKFWKKRSNVTGE